MAAAKAPDRVAIETPERRLTYSEVWEAAVGAAGALERLGVRAGDRVALALPPGEEFVVAMHGSLALGAAAVPIDLRLTDAERAQRRAGAEVVVSEPLRGSLAGQPARPAGGGGSDAAVVLGGGGSDAPIVLGGGPSDAAIVPGGGSYAAIVHTSGTTAAPKPVPLTDGNFLASALGSAVALGLDQNERWLCPMPLTHVGGLSIPIRSAIYATTAVLHGRFDTEAVLNELMDPARRITLVSLVPTMLARLLDAGLERPPTLRWALLGGGPIAPALLERARLSHVPVAPTYGMTGRARRSPRSGGRCPASS